MNIRQMAPADTPRVFALRRHALLDAPFAFLSSAEDDRAQTVEIMQDLLNLAPGSVVFGAEAGPLAGMVGIYRGEPAKGMHKAHIWGLYVVAGHRGAGLGRGLLGQAVAQHGLWMVWRRFI